MFPDPRLHLFFHFCQITASFQHHAFNYRKIHISDKIPQLFHFHLRADYFLLHIDIIWCLRTDTVTLISQNRGLIFPCHGSQQSRYARGKFPAKQLLSASAFRNHRPVKGQNIAPVPVQLQLLRQWPDPVGGPSGSQYDPAPLLLIAEQGSLRAGRDFLFIIRKGSVKVKNHQTILFHFLFLPDFFNRC